MHKKGHVSFLKRHFRNIFLKDVTLKLLSLLVAIGLWFAVTGSERIEAVKRIPLEYITAPGLVASADTPTAIDIRIIGPRIFIREVLERKEYIKIDIRDRKAGLFTYKFTPDIMKLPIGIRVEDFYPSSVNIKLEKLNSKTVKLVPSIVSQPANGFRVENVKVEPSSVEISGSEGALAKTTELYTQVIDISGKKEPLSTDVLLDHRYKRMFKSFSAERFTVYVDIRPIMLEKRFNGLKLKVVGHNNFKVETRVVDVVLNGPKEKVEKLDPDSIKPYIDISFNAPGRYSEQVSVRLPEGMELTGVYPKKVNVNVFRGE